MRPKGRGARLAALVFFLSSAFLKKEGAMCIFLYYNVQSLAEQYGPTHSCATTCKEVKLRPWLGAPPRAELMLGNPGNDVWQYLDLARPS